MSSFDFERETDGTSIPTASFNDGTYAAVVSSEAGEVCYFNAASRGRALSNTAPAPLTVDVTQGAPTFIAGTFFLTEVDRKLLPGDLSITVTYSGGSSEQHAVTALDATFVGFVAPTGESVTSLRLTTSTEDAYNSIRKLYLGQADLTHAAAVPEPATYALLAGLAGLILAWRRKLTA